jgi:acyl-CoA hydrolase
VASSSIAGSVILRFLAAPTDVVALGESRVSAGRILEWVDKAAYACAVNWSSGYCVTAYVGNISFDQPIHSGEIVEARARLVLTGRSSMHIRVDVAAAPVATGRFRTSTSCLVIFVAVDDQGRSRPVPTWTPTSDDQREEARRAAERIQIRKAIEAAMSRETYTDQSQAPRTSFMFLAQPTDVNWGGKTHGGTVMRWIDETAWACAVRWSGTESTAVFSGGVRFYRPIPIGNLVRLEARLLHTGYSSMHIAVHVSCAAPEDGDFKLTTHCLTVFVALADGRPVKTPSWHPVTEEDRRLDAHAEHLMELRTATPPGEIG